MQRIRHAGLDSVRRQDALLDRFLLELILIDSLAALDPRRAHVAEQVIDRWIPPQCYERVMERYDCLSGDGLTRTHLSSRRLAGANDHDGVLHAWLPRAAQKGSGWKSKMILCFLDIVRVDGRITDNGLADVAALAWGMGAERECRRLFVLALGVDPFAQPVGASITITGAPFMAAPTTVGLAGR